MVLGVLRHGAPRARGWYGAPRVPGRHRLAGSWHGLRLQHCGMACAYSIAVQLGAPGQHGLAESRCGSLLQDCGTARADSIVVWLRAPGRHGLVGLWHSSQLSIPARLMLMASQSSSECWGCTGCTGCCHCGMARAYGIAAWLWLTTSQCNSERRGSTGCRHHDAACAYGITASQNYV